MSRKTKRTFLGLKETSVETSVFFLETYFCLGLKYTYFWMLRKEEEDQILCETY